MAGQAGLALCLSPSEFDSFLECSRVGWKKWKFGAGGGESCFRLFHLISTLRITKDNSFLLNAEELHHGVMESLRGGRGSQSGFSLAFERLASFTLPVALVPFFHGDVWYLSLSLLEDGFATNLYFRCRVLVRSNEGPQSGFSTLIEHPFGKCWGCMYRAESPVSGFYGVVIFL